MLTKTRSDFWKCNCAPMAINVAYNLTRCICCGLHRNDERKYQSRPATNVEVLIAWLSADDERRKEIEIASRPTKAGEYVRYEVGEVATIDTDFIILTPQNMEVMIELYPDCLWELLSE